MAWLIINDPRLSNILVNSNLRQGTPLDFEECPYEEWITLSEVNELPNLLRVFLIYLDTIGQPVELEAV
jgi:hypothetical protein